MNMANIELIESPNGHFLCIRLWDWATNKKIIEEKITIAWIKQLLEILNIDYSKNNKRLFFEKWDLTESIAVHVIYTISIPILQNEKISPFLQK